MPENEHIIGTNRLVSPNDLKRQTPLSQRGMHVREKAVQTLREIIKNRNEKIAIIV